MLDLIYVLVAPLVIAAFASAVSVAAGAPLFTAAMGGVLLGLAALVGAVYHFGEGEPYLRRPPEE
jgi:hypothetical protein